MYRALAFVCRWSQLAREVRIAEKFRQSWDGAWTGLDGHPRGSCYPLTPYLS